MVSFSPIWVNHSGCFVSFTASTHLRLPSETLSLQGIYGVHVQALILLLRKFAPQLQELHLSQLQLESGLPGEASAPRACPRLWTQCLKSIIYGRSMEG